MLRLFIIFTFLFFNLQASCEGGYDSCKQKILDSNSINNQTIQIPISKHQRLVFSYSIPHAKIIKHDPFLSLYLVKDKKGFRYPFTFNNMLVLGQAALNKRYSIEGKIRRNQVGLNRLASFSEGLFVPSIITSSCCSLEGIVTPKGIIQKEYLQRFINSKNVNYSDIGIRVKNKRGLVIVTSSDPFMKNNQFKKDDCILEYDNRKVKRASVFMRKVLFCKIGSTHTIKIKRNSKIIILNIKTKKRFGGGYVSDTFLEQKGIYFDENLKIIKIRKQVENYGLLVGDKLLGANGTKVKNQQELMQNISNFKDFASLLFQRGNFQFFVQVN